MIILSQKTIDILLIFFAVCLAQPITNISAQPSKKTHNIAVDLKSYCPNTTLQTAQAISVNETAEVVLDDGRYLRFANIFFPDGTKNNTLPAETLRFLRAHLSNKTIMFFQSSKPDRYLRIPAHIITRTKDGLNQWFQPHIIKAGFGLFMPEPLKKHRTPHCDNDELKQLLKHHDHQSRLLKNRTNLIQIHASNSKVLWQKEGYFAIIEGAVLKTHISEKNIFLNFGTEWKSDFTAVVARDSKRSLSQHFKSFFSLEGKRLQLRGFIDLYNGPNMRIDHPLQVELLIE